MKKILFVAPSSYPVFGAEANVNANLLKALSDYGFDIDLVSRANGRLKCYPDSDSDYFFGKLSSINVIKVDTNYDVKTIIRHVQTYLKSGYLYKGIDWAYNAIKVCESLMKTNKYDFVMTKDAPAEIVGLYLAKEYGVKWIPTWNDPYLKDKYPPPYGKGENANVGYFRDKVIESISQYAYHHIFPSEQLRDYMLRYMTGMKREKCTIIPHVLLPKNENRKNRSFRSDDTLRILHAGALGKERDPINVFKGLKQFIRHNPQAKIHLTLLGVFENRKIDYLEGIIEDMGVSNYVELKPPIKYEKSLDIIGQYDVMLIIEAILEKGIFLPSKVIDYLQCKKPIFAVSPRVGVINDLYKDKIVDYFADNTNPNEITEEFAKIYLAFQRNRLFVKKKDVYFFESENVIKQLLNILVENVDTSMNDNAVLRSAGDCNNQTR